MAETTRDTAIEVVSMHSYYSDQLIGCCDGCHEKVDTIAAHAVDALIAAGLVPVVPNPTETERDSRDVQLSRIIRSVMRQSDLPDHQLEKLQAVAVLLSPRESEAMASVVRTAAEVDRTAHSKGISFAEAVALLEGGVQ